MTALETYSEKTKDGTYERHLIKGTSVKNFEKYCNENIENGLFKELAIQTELSYSGTVMPSTWYSVMRFKQITDTIADQLEIPTEQLISIFSPYMIEKDMNGVYRFLFRIMKAPAVLSKAPRIDDQYNNYAKYLITHNEYGLHKGTLTCPVELLDWHLAFVKSGLSKMIELCNSQVISCNAQRSADQTADEQRTTLLEIKYF